MAVILYQRGMCVLHASVIEAQGTAIAFLGHIGAGKSSTAAAFYARGHRILNDDNAAIQMCSGTPLVVPGFPYIKLFPAIASSLGFQIGDLRILHETQVKLAGPVHSGFSDRPLPLRTIYVLGRDHSKDMTRLSPLNATMQLIRNSVPTRWGQRGDSRHLEQWRGPCESGAHVRGANLRGSFTTSWSGGFSRPSPARGQCVSGAAHQRFSGTMSTGDGCVCLLSKDGS